MNYMGKARLPAAIALGAAAAITPVTASTAMASPASAATPGPNTPEKVTSGINVSEIPGVIVFPDVPADTPETVSFILRERHLSHLERRVESGVRNYLSVSQFASIYGQSQPNIRALTRYLAAFGISTDVYADRVDVTATGTAGQFNQALSVTQNWYQVPRQPGRGGLAPVPAQRVHGIAHSPLLPYRLAKFVLAILGLTNYGPFDSQAVHPTSPLQKVHPLHTGNSQIGSPGYCLALDGLSDACHLPQDFATEYGLNGLYDKGAYGSGQTIAVVTLAALDPGPAGYQWAPDYFWAKVARIKRAGTLTVQDIDGGPGAPSGDSGSVETDLDVEQSGGIAPGANVIVYQAPNTPNGFADAFFTAASQNIASSVSVSWGYDETQLRELTLTGQVPTTMATAFDESFLEMAIQGQSGFAASGDFGAYDALYIGTTNLSVLFPASSPYLTAAGGTTLPWTGTIAGPDGTATVTVPSQRIWASDYLWQAIAHVNGLPLAKVAKNPEILGGSGGGFSTIELTPSYQRGVPGANRFHAVQYLTPTRCRRITDGLVLPTDWTFNPAPGVTTGHGAGRNVPDISANADAYTGYLVYAPSAAEIDVPVLDGFWGGTSFVAPQLGGAAAVINSYLGRRAGFWNPRSYAAALTPDSPFTPLDTAGTSNDNIYYTGNPGKPYNQGAGLGYPNLTKLAEDFSLQMQGAAPAAPTAPATPGWHAGLHWPLVVRGDSGPRVAAIQYLLNQRTGACLKTDGIFGPRTERAVREFQAEYGLAVDGKAGNQTWSHLIITVSRGSTGPAVSAVQYLLEYAYDDPEERGTPSSPCKRGNGGSPPPPVTGYFGPITQAAVRSFQAEQYIAVDGIVGPVTWNALVIHEP